MKRTGIILAGAFALGLAVIYPGGYLPTAALAASATAQDEQTTVFDIENMTCALCPVTVKTAMEAVTGVEAVDVNFDKKTQLSPSTRQSPMWKPSGSLRQMPVIRPRRGIK